MQKIKIILYKTREKRENRDYLQGQLPTIRE